MFKVKIFICAFLTILLLMPFTAQAGHDDDEIPPQLQKKYDRRLEEMKALDTNQDGILQTEELGEKPKASFDAADTDKDGVLSRKEIEAARESTKTKSKEKYGSKNIANNHAAKIKSQLKNADTNDDGKVSAEEYEAYYGAKYGTYDRDGDGVVTEKEYRTDLEKLPGAYRWQLRESSKD